jgi:hypothetical protein
MRCTAEVFPQLPVSRRRVQASHQCSREFSKAKPAEEGKPKPIDIAVPGIGYKNHASIGMWTRQTRGRMAAIERNTKPLSDRSYSCQAQSPDFRHLSPYWMANVD